MTSLQTLNAAHQWLINLRARPHTITEPNSSKDTMYAQCLLDAAEEITIARIKIENLKNEVDALAGMKLRKKELEAEVQRLNQLLNPLPDVATVAAQGQGRGIDENEPREG